MSLLWVPAGLGKEGEVDQALHVWEIRAPDFTHPSFPVFRDEPLTSSQTLPKYKYSKCTGLEPMNPHLVKFRYMETE